MCDDICEDNVKLKQYIIDGGFYDPGMSIDDMKQMYKTLNRSKQTANNEIEYREILSQTDLNCSSIELLKTEDNNTDDINNSETLVFATPPERSTTNTCRSRKTPKRGVKTDIHLNFPSTSNYKPVVSVTQRKNICPILYHHPTILKLPLEDRAEIILLYLENQDQFQTVEIKPPVAWCKPIVPLENIKFNNDLCVEAEPEFADNTITTEKSESTATDFITLRSTGRQVRKRTYVEGDIDEKLPVTLIQNTKSSTTVERNVTLEKLKELPSTSSKPYSQKDDSDEDLYPRKSKKPKSDANSGTVVNKSTPVQKPSETTTTNRRWIPKMSKLFTISSDVYDKTNKVFDKLKEEEIKRKANNVIPNVNARTKKLFDKLKKEETKKAPNANNLKLNDISDGSDCDEIFPITTNVNIHNEATSKLKRGKAPAAKKVSAKSRKKLSLKTSNDESNATPIPAINFYGKNKENELDATNNNKSTTSNMTECPICSRSFPSTEIEEHAASCEQFADSQAESLCVICSKYITNIEMDAHKFICLETITEGSTEKTCKNTNNSNLGIVCEICDTFVIDSNELEHASNCIGIVNDE